MPSHWSTRSVQSTIFSRVGWRMITLPLVETFAFYFLFRAFETKLRRDFAIAGALLALQLDTYLAGRIIPVIRTYERDVLQDVTYRGTP